MMIFVVPGGGVPCISKYDSEVKCGESEVGCFMYLRRVHCGFGAICGASNFQPKLYQREKIVSKY